MRSSLQVWNLSGPRVYTKERLITAKLRPFELPAWAEPLPGAPRFKARCPYFRGTLHSCDKEERCRLIHAKPRQWG